MGRWQPGTRGRLQATALELFVENGFEATTVAEIARSADVTERTFYRYFADKREVLFDGQEILQDAFVSGVAGAPADATPLEAAAAGLAGAADFFTSERRSWSRGRQTVIDSDPGLQERELLKLTSLSTTLAAALRERGVPDPQAGLAADSVLSVFRIAFAAWIAADETRSMSELQTDTLATLRALSLP